MGWSWHGLSVASERKGRAVVVQDQEALRHLGSFMILGQIDVGLY